MYAIRNKRIFKAEAVKPTKNNTGWWCRLDDGKKHYLISNINIHEEFITALNSLKRGR